MWDEKRFLIWWNFLLMLVCFLGYFVEFLIFNGVVILLVFLNLFFDLRIYFVYYVCVFMIGEFIGRFYIIFLFLLNLKCILVIMRIWILVIMFLSFFIFLIFVLWYCFFYSVWVVLLLIFIVGFLVGSLYLNIYFMVVGSEDVKGKVFLCVFFLVGFSIGVLVVGLVGLVLELILREYCFYLVEFSEFCFIRVVGGWNRIILCLW